MPAEDCILLAGGHAKPPGAVASVDAGTGAKLAASIVIESLLRGSKSGRTQVDADRAA